jgi:decaprenylphospho-beta-D-ribofuranose 2-oxidase
MSTSTVDRLRSLFAPGAGQSGVRSLSGWGRTNPTVAEVESVTPGDLADAVSRAGARGALVRGLGRSYGDAAQNAGGLVVTLDDAGSPAVVDHTTGTVTVPAGRSLDALLRELVPAGWFVPVTPGTRFVTVGGAIASDIHGKNHHVDGSFGEHVVSLRLLTADGSVLDLGPDSDVFWATIGGMGLTGVILDATVRLLRIETSRMSVDTTRIPDLDTLFASMSEGDETFRYSVAWIDLMATGRQLGRSVLTRGDHATLDRLDEAAAASPLAYGPRQLVDVPPIVPPMGVLNRATVGAFNELWFRKSPRRRVGELQTIANYFHPLDLVGSWNRLYGARGMVQYQFVVPFGEEEALREVIERLSESGVTSFLAVLKRFGAASRAPLSFPFPGWTLALDVPSASGGLAELLHGLDRLVLDAGGRHYFAKDACTTREAVRRGYPRLDEWKAVRERVDPTGRWQSDLGRRLGLLD